MSLQIVKGTLLAVADQILGVLTDVIMENAAMDKGKCQKKNQIFWNPFLFERIFELNLSVL